MRTSSKRTLKSRSLRCAIKIPFLQSNFHVEHQDLRPNINWKHRSKNGSKPPWIFQSFHDQKLLSTLSLPLEFCIEPKIPLLHVLPHVPMNFPCPTGDEWLHLLYGTRWSCEGFEAPERETGFHWWFLGSMNVKQFCLFFLLLIIFIFSSNSPKLMVCVYMPTQTHVDRFCKHMQIIWFCRIWDSGIQWYKHCKKHP